MSERFASPLDGHASSHRIGRYDMYIGIGTLLVILLILIIIGVLR